MHLGTHGFFESPARIAALRAAVRREDPLGPGPSRPPGPGRIRSDFALTPLLRSGVVLAGGGRDPGLGVPDASADAPPREDGILTAEEVQALDLRGTELVVLSACETGLGELEHGQGVMGLQRAFQAAGARAVVASLWKVDDAATTVLMEQFYTNLWDKKLPKLEALRQAQLAVLNDPGLVTKRRAELAKERGIGEKSVKLADGRADRTSECPCHAERSRPLGRLRLERGWTVSVRSGKRPRPHRLVTTACECMLRTGRTSSNLGRQPDLPRGSYSKSVPYL